MFRFAYNNPFCLFYLIYIAHTVITLVYEDVHDLSFYVFFTSLAYVSHIFPLSLLLFISFCIFNIYALIANRNFTLLIYLCNFIDLGKFHILFLSQHRKKSYFGQFLSEPFIYLLSNIYHSHIYLHFANVYFDFYHAYYYFYRSNPNPIANFSTYINLHGNFSSNQSLHNSSTLYIFQVTPLNFYLNLQSRI